MWSSCKKIFIKAFRNVFKVNKEPLIFQRKAKIEEQFQFSGLYKNKATKIGIDNEMFDQSTGPKETTSGTENADEVDSPEMTNLIKAITICIPYSANIGGTATLTGSAPNLILAGQFEQYFPDAPHIFTFGGWIAYFLPGAALTLILAYIWLSNLFLGFNPKEIKSCICCSKKTETEDKAQEILQDEFNKLGVIKWGEGTVLGVFVLTVLLWFFREPGFMPGWGQLFVNDGVTDGTVAIAMGFLLCILPMERPNVFSSFVDSIITKPKKSILNWQLIHKKMAWNVLFILGGGFAMAAGAANSGLSTWIGKQLAFLNGIEPWAICLIVTIIVCLFTECSSNIATASLFAPILAELAIVIQVNPLFLMVAPGIAASMAFLLPASTPTIAIAFSHGRLRVIDLIKSGWMMKVIAIAVITLFINTYGVAYFGLTQNPDWAQGPNDDVVDVTDSWLNATERFR